MVYYQIEFKIKIKTQPRWRLKKRLSWTERLGQQQTRLNTIPLVNLKPETVTGLGIVLFYVQIMHITYRNVFTCNAFNPPFIIPEGELFCPAKFMKPMIKTSYCYYDPYESIPVILKLKQVVMP